MTAVPMASIRRLPWPSTTDIIAWSLSKILRWSSSSRRMPMGVDSLPDPDGPDELTTLSARSRSDMGCRSSDESRPGTKAEAALRDDDVRADEPYVLRVDRVDLVLPQHPLGDEAQDAAELSPEGRPVRPSREP